MTIQQAYIAHTSTGAEVYYLEPERTEIRWADLITHLSRMCRYGGACEWSVLQHLALCVGLARREGMNDRTVALVAAHDLSEAYVPDIPRAIKPLVPGYRQLEDRWSAHIHRSLGLAMPNEDEADAIHCIDRRSVLLETWLRHPEHLAEAVRHDPEPMAEGEKTITRLVARERVSVLGAYVRGAVERGAA